VDAVVALVGVEAALGDPLPDLRGGVDAEARHAHQVGAHVGLADQHRAYAERTQVIADGHLSDLERDEVPARAVCMHVAPGVVAHPRGAADRRLRVRAVEDHAARRQTVDVRGVQARVAEARQVVVAQLVAHDEEDVAHLAHGRRSLRLDGSGDPRAPGPSRPMVDFERDNLR